MVAGLRDRMGLLFLLFFLLTAISVSATLAVIHTHQKDALVINLAGRQRMLIQQMAGELRLLEQRPARTGGAGQDAEIAALQSAAHTFDQTLLALSEGDTTSSPNGEAAATLVRPNILNSLQQIRQNWTALQSELAAIAAGHNGAPPIDALQSALRLSATLARQSDDLVRQYETAAMHKVERLSRIQGLFFAGALLLLAAGVWVTQKSAIEPLRGLGAAAARIGRGDLATPVAVAGPAEIQLLSTRFDAMRTQLQDAQARLLTWGEQMEAQVRRRTQELAALHEVSQEISSRLEIAYVLRSVTDKARALLGAEAAFLCLLDEQNQQLNLQAVSGSRAAVCASYVPAQQPLIGYVLAGDAALPCGIEGCMGMCKIITPSFQTSHLAAPLRVGERVIGALCVGSTQMGVFSPDDITLLTRLANSAAIALENARLYEQAERAAMLEERQRIAGEMHDGLAQTLRYLAFKTEFLADRLAAPPSGNTGGNGKQDGEVEKTIQQIAAAVEQASQDVRRSIASLQAPPVPRCPLQEQLASVADAFAAEGAPPLAFECQVRQPLILPADQAEQVVRVVQEALQNVQRHAQARRVLLCLAQAGAEARVCVTDDGQGFDLKAPPTDGRRRFGLSIMRARAARIGGQLTVQSIPGQGTTLTLAWPLDPPSVEAVGVEAVGVEAVEAAAAPTV